MVPKVAGSSPVYHPSRNLKKASDSLIFVTQLCGWCAVFPETKSGSLPDCFRKAEKRMAPRLPKYRLHKPTGQGITTIRGRDYYFGKFEEEASEQKYRRLIAEYLISDHSPTFGVKATE